MPKQISRYSKVLAPVAAAAVFAGGCAEQEPVDPTISHIQRSDLNSVEVRYITPDTTRILGNISTNGQLVKLLVEGQKAPSNSWYDYYKQQSIDGTPRRFGLRLSLSGRQPSFDNDAWCEGLKVADGATKIGAVAIADPDAMVSLSWNVQPDGSKPEVLACVRADSRGLISPEVVAFVAEN